ncbi:MAG: HD domain-containing protein, partial [Planctomycetes bacterium]|nr:HD domain-containing protein [Planctomycetota bacterium]
MTTEILHSHTSCSAGRPDEAAIGHEVAARAVADPAALEAEIDELTRQLEHTWEEITLLHEVARNLQVSRSPAEVATLCLDRMRDVVGAQGSVIWLEEKGGETRFLVDGRLPFDQFGLARLVARFEGERWTRPLVKNHIRGTLLGADFAGLENLVIVPVSDGTKRAGWIVSANLPGREFGTVEASLLNSLATMLGTHLRNIELYRQHEELIVSFVRSLVHTLDAKDPYTRGHSERVALIARRLGRELGLDDRELHDLYLAGLLHDIGKIGVDDRILQKPGRLTDGEFQCIQEHPLVGYSILQGLTN